MQELEQLNCDPYTIIILEELIEKKKFYRENKDLMEELAIMGSILSPYSDEEKTRWILHK